MAQPCESSAAGRQAVPSSRGVVHPRLGRRTVTVHRAVVAALAAVSARMSSRPAAVHSVMASDPTCSSPVQH